MGILKDVIKNIEIHIGDMTKSQRKVADYIVKNAMQAAFSTVDQLAHTVGVSTTTIVRLALTLGYVGYAEFQKNLQEYIQTRSGPTAKLELNVKNVKLKNDILNEIVKQQMENINETFNNLSDDLVTKATEILKKANHIYVTGYRSSFGVAHYLSFNLDRIFGNCDLLTSEGGEVSEKVSRITKGDVVIALSMPRYIKQVTTICEIAKKRGAKIIAITDGYLSPLAVGADVLFSAETKSLDFHNSLLATMVIAELLISISSLENPTRVKTQLMDTEQVLQLMDIHVNK